MRAFLCLLTGYHDAALLFDCRSEPQRQAREARGYAVRDGVRTHGSTYLRLLLGWDGHSNVIPFPNTRKN